MSSLIWFHTTPRPGIESWRSEGNGEEQLTKPLFEKNYCPAVYSSRASNSAGQVSDSVFQNRLNPPSGNQNILMALQKRLSFKLDLKGSAKKPDCWEASCLPQAPCLSLQVSLFSCSTCPDIDLKKLLSIFMGVPSGAVVCHQPPSELALKHSLVSPSVVYESQEEMHVIFSGGSGQS